MKFVIPSLFGTIVLLSCTANKSTESLLEYQTLQHEYYENLGKNICRLHHLMQGAFVSYSYDTAGQLQYWNVTDGDSVVLYSKPIGEISKQGYWIYSYEFMTSLPNDPIYTSIKKIDQIDRDTFEISYYKSPKVYKLTEILDDNFSNKLDFDDFIKTDKKVRYIRQNNTQFIGSSIIYEDPQCHCLRKNIYDITPTSYEVSSDFYSKKDTTFINRKKRPNFLVRRPISQKELIQIANKEYALKRH
ncbi:MAG: hypothetical protein MK212_02850 [Saprospiraceae bacterium]|nr:hypothetical protein [Saprospiraceae bacterium]